MIHTMDPPTIEAPPRVLVADDDPEVRSVISWALRLEGYDVIELGNGHELFAYIGMSLFESENARFARPDVIVSDVLMPGFSGLDALGAARRTGLDIPFILITAHGDPDARTRAREDGATAFFSKPLEIGELIQAVEESLRSRHPPD